MPRHQKAERTGGIYANRSEYFKKGKDPGLYADKGSAHHQGGEELADGYSRVAHQDAPEPVAFTQSRTARKGGGFDLGPKEYIYKKVTEKKAEAPKQEAAPEPEVSIPTPVEEKPIKHSPEVRQAKERVRAYEDGVMSRKTSDDTYGGSSDTNDAINSRYTLGLNKGAAGIGTTHSGSEPTSKATENFLASKTADVKNKYQFQAK